MDQLLERGDSQPPITSNLFHQQEYDTQATSDPGDSTVPGGVSAESTASPGPLIRSIGTAEVAPSALGDFTFDSPWPVSFANNDPVWHLAMVRHATSSSAAPSFPGPLSLAPNPSSVFGQETGNSGGDGGSGDARPRAATPATALGQTRPPLNSQGQSSTHLLQLPSISQDRGKAKELATAPAQRQ